MSKRFCLLCVLLVSLLLTGCMYTVDAHRVWVLCKLDGNIQYYYNDVGDFIKVEDGVVKAHGGAGLTRLPALHFEPSEYTPEFYYVLPGHFRGNLLSVQGYVNAVAESYEVTYSDPYSLTIYVETGDDTLRIIYKTSGDIQIYAKSGDTPKDIKQYVTNL